MILKAIPATVALAFLSCVANAQDAQEIRQHREHGHHDQRGRHLRDHQLAHRICAQRGDGVDLLRHLHGADLGQVG